MKIPVRNIPLLAVLSLTALVSVYLIYLVVVKHSQVAEVNSKIAEHKKILEDANRRKPPAPLAENYKNITIDTAKVAMETFLLQRKFGQFYRKPLLLLANAVGISGDALKESFTKYYEELPDLHKRELAGSDELIADFLSGKDRNRLESEMTRYRDYLNESALLNAFAEYYNGLPNEKRAIIPNEVIDRSLLMEFLSRYDAEKVKKGLAEFRDAMTSVTVEKVTDENVHKFVLVALGLPRTMEQTQFVGQQNNFVEELNRRSSVPGAESVDDVEKQMSSVEIAPLQKDIPRYIFQWSLREEIFRRLREAGGVKKDEEWPLKLISIREKTPTLLGVKQGSYQYYDFELVLEAASFKEDAKEGAEAKVYSAMNTIRKLINTFQTAYKDNVVYLIRDIAMERADEVNVEDLIDPQTKNPLLLLIEQFQILGYELKESDAYILAATYGRPMIGGENRIKVTMTVRMVFYTGNQLQRIEQKN